MRRAPVLAAFAAAALLAARGQQTAPTNPKNDPAYWSFPQAWTYGTVECSWTQRGQTFKCVVDLDEKVKWNGPQINDEGIQKAVENALLANLKAEMLQDQVDTIAIRLAALNWDEKEAEVEDTASGAKAGGTISRTPERFVVAAPGVLSGGMGPDGVTIQTNAAGRAALLGWDAPRAGSARCDDTLGDMLDMTKKSGPDHYVLTRFGSSGTLHYTPVGFVPMPITAQFELLGGKVFQLRGSTSPGNAGKLLASTGDGICWTNMEAGVRVYADGTQLPHYMNGVFGLAGPANSVRANFAPPENWAGAGLALAVAEDGAESPMKLALDGLADAEEGTVPTADGRGGVAWKPAAAAGELRVRGTTGEFVSGTNVVFRAAEDSDVRVTATVEDGAVVLTFGVYYK